MEKWSRAATGVHQMFTEGAVRFICLIENCSLRYTIQTDCQIIKPIINFSDFNLCCYYFCRLHFPTYFVCTIALLKGLVAENYFHTMSCSSPVLSADYTTNLVFKLECKLWEPQAVACRSFERFYSALSASAYTLSRAEQRSIVFCYWI